MGLRRTAQIAGLALATASTTAGLAVAGVVSLPDLPEAASDRAESVHQTLEQGGHPGPAEQAGQSEAGARSERRSDRRPDSATRARTERASQAGSHDDFGESVSQRAMSGEPQEDGREFGESVSTEARERTPAPAPQAETGRETGQAIAEQGGANGQAPPAQGPETGQTAGEQGRQIGDTASGGRVPSGAAARRAGVC